MNRYHYKNHYFCRFFSSVKVEGEVYKGLMPHLERFSYSDFSLYNFQMQQLFVQIQHRFCDA